MSAYVSKIIFLKESTCYTSILRGFIMKDIIEEKLPILFEREGGR
jgi:hypothetical protein